MAGSGEPLEAGRKSDTPNHGTSRHFVSPQRAMKSQIVDDLDQDCSFVVYYSVNGECDVAVIEVIQQRWSLGDELPRAPKA